MKLEDLKKLMQSQVVEFSYIKKDGTTRTAHGTTNFDLVEEFGQDKLPKGTGTEPNGVTRYFDVDREAWRSFQNESYIEY